MIIYNKYVNNEDLTWYDSSNVVFSKCYDNNQDTKTLKIVFKNGRTYLYKDVAVNDYICFKNAESTGSAINTYIIKKYSGVRISDTDISKIEELKENYINAENELSETSLSNVIYHIIFNADNGQIQLKLNDNVLYNGIEGQISIFNLLKSMNIRYSTEKVDEIIVESDENKEEITIN